MCGALLVSGTVAAPARAQTAGQPVAQAGDKVGVFDDPCKIVEPIPPEVIAFIASSMKARAAHLPPPTPSPEGLAKYNAWQVRQLQQDFAQHCRYQAANAALSPATDHRVVMFGDSITELWGMLDPGFFQNDVIDRGISGQTTAQMIGRFREDVIDLHPRVVHILAGANDVAGNTGPTSLDWIMSNIEAMVELARAHGITVVLGSELPAARFGWRPSIEPIANLQELNRRLRAYANQEGIAFVDYYTPLVDDHAAFKASLTEDGVHPNAAGYAIMRPLAKAALARALTGAK